MQYIQSRFLCKGLNIMIKLQATAFAPVNIALVKYWGKRDEVLNLPVTSSLSVALNNHGATTTISVIDASADLVLLENILVPADDAFYIRLVGFLNLFRKLYDFPNLYFQVNTASNLPIAAGLASSASGFAAITLALDQLLGLNLSKKELSILARRGSGSACRSVYQGFVLWQAGELHDGSDSFALPLEEVMYDLRVGLLIFNRQKKSTSSTKAMRESVQTCPFYKIWPNVVAQHIKQIKHAIVDGDFNKLGSIAETNALYMHSLMQATTPPTIYATADTINCIKKIWQLREHGLELYFTQDAGPNLKLLYLAKDSKVVREQFASYEPIEINVFGV
jgi:diphosphomevalonate decarboxylase